MVTTEGTEAAELLVCRVITSPAEAAVPPIVTVPIEVFPPSTVDGERLIAVTGKGLIVRVAD